MQSGLTLDHTIPEATIWVPEGMALVCIPRDDTPGGQLVRAICVWLPQAGEFSKLAEELFALKGLRLMGDHYEIEIDEDQVESLPPRMKELLLLMSDDEGVSDAFGQYLMSLAEHN